MTRKVCLFFFFALFVCCFSLASEKVVTYPAPVSVSPSPYYSAEVIGNDITYPVFTYFSETQMPEFNLSKSVSYAIFSFTGSVELRITMLDGTFTECKVLPSSYGIEPITNGHIVSFFLDRPRKISVEFDNDITHALLIFADEPEENVPSQEDPDVLYFGPGIHDLEEPISPISGQTVYIAGGAIVKGLIEAENVSNVTVRGRGILDGRKYGHTHGRHIYFKGQNAFGISIEGITIVDSPGYMLTSQVRNTQVIFKH